MERLERITIKYWSVFLLVGLFSFFFHKMFISQVKEQSSSEVTVDLPHTNPNGLTQRHPNSQQETDLRDIINGLNEDSDSTNRDLKEVISKLSKAKAAFAAPDTVFIGEEFPAKLVIEPFAISKNFKIELQKELSMIHGSHKPKVLDDTIFYSGVMEAKLQTELTNKLMNEPSKKLINPLGTTTWNWLVTPKEPGIYPIYLELSVNIKLHGTETPFVIHPWQRNITVDVTKWGKFWNYLETAEGKIEIITKFFGLLFGSGGVYGIYVSIKKLINKNETP